MNATTSSHRLISLLLLTSFAFLLRSARAADVALPLPNPGFEQFEQPGQPAHWTDVVIGVAPQFSLDKSNPHGGSQSMKISAAEVTRAYVQSKPIPVAPAEKITATAYVKLQDVPEKTGAVILIAHFSRADGANAQVEKFATAKLPTTTQPMKGWQEIKGSIVVPADVDNLRIRAGFSYSKGVSWWDDIHVATSQPVVARVSLPENRLSPAIDPLPITLINRTNDHSRIRVALTLDKKTFSAETQLTGEPTQILPLPIEIQKRGKTAIELALFKSDQQKPFYTHKQDAVVPPAIALDPPIPTHWAVEDGAPKIAGDVWTALKPETQRNGKLTVKLVDSSNKTLATWTAPKIDPEHNTFTLNAPALPEGKYTVVAEVQPPTGQPLTHEQPFTIIPRRLARVTINSDGYCVYDQKPIFPMGIFNSGKPQEEAEAGFTVTHAYNATRVFKGVRPDDQAALEFLNRTEKAGMKACFMVPLAFAQDGDWNAFRRRIRMFKNHPALLCWDEEEGLARGDWKMDTLQKVYQILKEEDPNHPFMVGDARDVIFRVKDRSNFFPLQYMDMGMWWWYPIPMSKKKTIDALEGEEVQGTELTPPTFLTQAKTDKPIWVGVQSYKKGAEEKMKAKQGRFPTPTEYRAQAYIAVAAGGKGLMWYGGYVTGGILAGKNRDEGHWKELKQLVTELHSLSDEFMSPSLDKPTISPAKAPISVAIKKSPKRTILIAVNRSEDPLDIQLSSPAIQPGHAAVISEARSIETKSGSLSDHFNAYATHVYELP